MAPKESSATLARGKGAGSHHQHGEPGAPRPDGTTPSSWDGRRFRLRLHSAQRNRPEPEESSWFGLRRSRWHPDPDHRKRNAMMEGFGQAEAVRFTFHQVGMTAGNEVLNPSTLPPGVVMNAQVPVFAIQGPQEQWLREVDEGPGPEYFVSGGVSERSAFAFLPLEAGTHRPRPGGELMGEDAFYGIYYMERSGGQGTWTYWMKGDYPVYMIDRQLSRASDECYPPLQVQVEFDQCKVVNVDFSCEEEAILARCSGMDGETLAEVTLEHTETLRGLHKKVLRELYTQRPDTPARIRLTLLNARTGQLLSPPPPRSEPDRKLLDLL